jgi:hypothetical protein
MRQFSVPPVLLATVLAACSHGSELLNSDRIRQRFGNYGVEVVSQDENLRRSSLYSTHAGQRICRTYAFVVFDQPVRGDISATHDSVLAGGSIGSTFRDSGWSIEKETLFIGSISSPHASPDLRRRMRLAGETGLAMHVYRLLLARDGRSLPYATIAEVHHPDYLTEAGLRGLYGDDLPDDPEEEAIAAIVALIRSD